jgi:hypothetical protein
VGTAGRQHPQACYRGLQASSTAGRASPPLHVPSRPPGGGNVVRDANGQALAYLYSRESEPAARQAKVLTADKARRIALNIARLGA